MIDTSGRMPPTNGNNGNGQSSEPTFNREEFARLQSLVENSIFGRGEFFNRFFGRRDSIDEECGWPGNDQLHAQFYRDLYDRNPLAERVVSVYPKECWQSTPNIYEDESSEDATEFEKAWDDLSKQLNVGPDESWHQDEEGSMVWSYLQRIDILSGIGSFGVLLFGLDDGQLLEQPAAGAPPDGNPGRDKGRKKAQPSTAGGKSGPLKDITGVTEATSGYVSGGEVKTTDPDQASDGGGKSQQGGPSSVGDVTKDIYGGQTQLPLKGGMGTDAQYFGVQFTPVQVPQTPDSPRLLFMRCFDESLVQVVQYEADIRNPRFGQPIMYLVTLNDPRQPHTGVGLPLATVRVHWSRVLHVADLWQTAAPSEVFGPSRLRCPLNNIIDGKKLYGGSAEMYWRGAFPGLSIETNPQLGGDVVVDKLGLDRMMQGYFKGLNRSLALMGMTAKSLAPQVVDPTAQIDKQIEAICIHLGCPVRVFKGSERGELASSQDDSAWLDRLRNRRYTYLTPRVIVPFVNRLILLGVLPEPKGFSVEWPDLDTTTKAQKSAIFLQRVQAYAAALAGGLDQMFTPKDMMTKLDGAFDEEEAQAIIDDAQEVVEEKQDDIADQAKEQGFEPAPPPGFQAPAPEPPPGVGQPGGPPMPPQKLGAGQSLVHPQTGKTIAKGPPSPKPPASSSKNAAPPKAKSPG